MIAELVLYIASAAYAAAAALYLADVASRGTSALLASRAHRALSLAALAHAAYIVMASAVSHVCPVLSLHFFGSFTALVATVLFIVVRKRADIDALGAYLAPIALALVLASHLFGAPRREVSGALLALHVTANMVGDALFLLATVAAVLYLVQERQLKHKRAAGLVGRLPPQAALDNAQHGFLVAGFVLLTIGIVTGIVRARQMPEGSIGDLVRAGLAWTSWALFGSVIAARAALGWRGRRAAWGTIVGFLFSLGVVIAYLLKRSGGPGA